MSLAYVCTFLIYDINYEEQKEYFSPNTLNFF